MYIMPTSTASDATRESALSDFSHSLLDFCKRTVGDGSGAGSAIVVEKLIEPDLT
jgi:hypothetical protein